MIYFHSNNGRNIYTKLDDVLEVNKPNDALQKQGFEKLGMAVNSNYQNFTQKLIGLQSRPVLQPYKKPQFSKGSLVANAVISNNPLTKAIKNPIVITEKSKEEQFLNIFTSAIKNNDDLIKNSNSCIDEIYKNLFKKVKKGGDMGENKDEKKDFKLKYQKEDQDFLEKINAKVEKNRRIYGNDNESENASNTEISSNKMNSQKKELNEKNFKLKKKMEKILIDALNYLYFNKIPIADFFNKNPFPTKPFSFKNSFEFFEAVKFNRKAEVEELLKINKAYLFDFDYFHQTAYHWAAKRGYKEVLEVLIRKGNHVNQFDNNRRTPLWLAAKNNQYECCSFLLAYEANPFLDNKDGKKPVEVTTDPLVKKLIIDYMEKHSELNSSNYFKANVLKKHKMDVVSLFKKKS